MTSPRQVSPLPSPSMSMERHVRARWGMRTALVAWMGATGALAACTDAPPAPFGFRDDAATGAEGALGPTVVFDLDARPLPDIPLPNDLATTPDPTSPTGRRLNVSRLAPSKMEERMRERIAKLDGFSTFGAISVRFDADLDLADIDLRHAPKAHRKPDGSTADTVDFSDDAIFLVPITPPGPQHGGPEGRYAKYEYGRPVPLDLGRGHFPPTVTEVSPQRYFPYDPRAHATSLLFETDNEDRNGDGILDPEEDTDFDGVLDRLNARDPKRPDANPVDDIAPHYERQTHTLLIRPIVPLREMTTYAVILTKRLKGENGAPIRSPYPHAHHAQQKPALEPLTALMAHIPLRPDGADGRPDLQAAPRAMNWGDVAFAWTFTTRSITAPLKAIRDGLYGHGTLARLAEEFPPDLHLEPLYSPSARRTNPYILKVDDNRLLVEQLVRSFAGGGTAAQDDMIDKFRRYVDYLFVGFYESPDFLADRDGFAQSWEETVEIPLADGTTTTLTLPREAGDRANEAMDIDPATGHAFYGRVKVPFICAIPKKDPARGIVPPYQVVIHMHGTGGARLQGIGFAGEFGRFGVAVCGIDSHSHGVPLERAPDVESSLREGLGLLGMAPFYKAFARNRVPDIDNDGLGDPCGDFWIFDAFHVAAAVQQTVVDQMQLIRALRACDFNRPAPIAYDSAKPTGLACDFDGDGLPDLGGPWLCHNAEGCDFDGDGVIDLRPEDNDKVSGDRYHINGISLGGIVAAVNLGVEPAAATGYPLSGGGGLTDISLRSAQQGVPEQVVMPLLAPLVLIEPASPNHPSHTHIRMVTALLNERAAHLVAKGAPIGPLGQVRLTNLRTGEVAQGLIPADGRPIRLAVGADALRGEAVRYYFGQCGERDKRKWPLVRETLGGLSPRAPDSCPAGFKSLNQGYPYPPLGDPLRVELFDAKGQLLDTIDNFREEVAYKGIRYAKDAPLVALMEGWGYSRQSPDLRKVAMLGQTAVDPADPVNWARHWFMEPLDFPYEPTLRMGSTVVDMITAGDQNVPTATGVTLARAAGILDYTRPRAHRGDVTDAEWLIDRFVLEGNVDFSRYTSEPKGGPFTRFDAARLAHKPILFDPDDLDENLDGFDAPSDPQPLRAHACADAGPYPWPQCGYLRIAYPSPRGAHALATPAPDRKFDIYRYSALQNAWLSASASSGPGPEMIDHVCLAPGDCPQFSGPVPCVRGDPGCPVRATPAGSQ